MVVKRNFFVCFSWCLRSWIEQDASCPTCRIALSMPRVAGDAQVAQLAQQDAGQEFAPGLLRRRHATNHFFHFDGRKEEGIFFYFNGAVCWNRPFFQYKKIPNPIASLACVWQKKF